MYDDLINQEKDNIPLELITKTESVDARTHISKAIQMLEKYPALIVNNGKEYYGIFDSRSISKSGAELKFQKNQTVEKYTTKVDPAVRKTTINELISYFYSSRIKALPFSDNKKIIGVLDRNTLLKMLLSFKMLEGIKVNEIMSSPVIAIDKNASLSQAMAAMEEKRINRILVMDGKTLQGMLTYFGLIQRYSDINERLPEFETKSYNPSGISISEIIEKNPKTIDSEDELTNATRKLANNNISSLIVVDKKQKPVGILTVSDILENLIARMKIEENRIFLTGFDKDTREFEPEIKEELKDFVSTIEKTRAQKVDYLMLHLKKVKGKLYDIKIKVAIKKEGILSAHITDFMLERTLKEAIDTLKKNVLKEKEKLITMKKKTSTESE